METKEELLKEFKFNKLMFRMCVIEKEDEPQKIVLKGKKEFVIEDRELIDKIIDEINSHHAIKYWNKAREQQKELKEKYGIEVR